MSKSKLQKTINSIENGSLMNIGAVHLSGVEMPVIELMSKISREFGAYQRTRHVVKTVPDTVTEVRYYYTEDKPEAARLVGALRRQSIKARASYVVDPQIQARRSYQIAFAKDSFSPPVVGSKEDNAETEISSVRKIESAKKRLSRIVGPAD